MRSGAENNNKHTKTPFIILILILILLFNYLDSLIKIYSHIHEFNWHGAVCDVRTLTCILSQKTDLGPPTMPG